MALERRFLRGREIRVAFRFIYGIQTGHLPITLGDLRQLFPLQIENIQMPEPAALARPQKAPSIMEKIQIVAQVYPVRILFAQEHMALSVRSAGDQEVELGLGSVQRLNSEVFRVAQPAHPRDVN